VPVRRRGPKRTHVFLNCPFDDDYEGLFLALIAGLTGLGLTPRCVLEIPADRSRLQRLFRLIRQCASSVHDLSRVQLSRRPPRVPRFNMPFELGLAVAFSLSQGRHRWYLVEAKKHRLQVSLSDVNGFDPYIHNGTPTGVLAALANAFVKRGKQPTLGELGHLYRAVRRFWGDLKRRERLSLFTARAFREVVVASLQIAERLQLL
jgi:hypothetical protein